MKNKKLLLATILLLGIGFAAVTTTLYITGNVKIATNNADFDVKFTKAVLDGTNISTIAISSDGKTIEYGTSDLKNVGDISKLDFEVTNNSTMYDANVSIECSTTGAKKDYYEITQSVKTPIVGKTIEKGKVQVKLLKASVTDFSETFTCTLNATAAERTTKAEGPKYAFGYPTSSSTQDYGMLKYPSGSKAGQPAQVFVKSEGSQKSVCTLATGSLECFRAGTNAYVAEEQKHLKEVFGEANCSGDYNVNCGLGAFSCEVGSDGFVRCYGDDHNCFIDSAGNIYCGE